jgi:hypothetical protein
MIDLSNWIAQLPAWLLSLWHGLGKIVQGVLWFLGASEREKISTAVWHNADGTIAKIITTTDTIPAKTVWDFLALVGVPVTLAVLTFVFQARQKEREEKREEAEKARQDERLREEGNEKALEDYLNQVSTLLIQNNLIQLAQDSPDSPTLETAKGVIRARTLSLLNRLANDPVQKTTVIWFLIESKILKHLQLAIHRTNLSGIDLSAANLSGINLFSTNLSGANLFITNLSTANLRDAEFIGASLIATDFSEARLIGANLKNANLTGAKLIGANLKNANLTGAKINLAGFSGAMFHDTTMPDGIARSGKEAKQYIEKLLSTLRTEEGDFGEGLG